MYEARTVVTEVRERLYCSEAVAKACDDLTSRETEHIVVLCLDTQLHLLSKHTVAQGGIDACTFDNRVILRTALMANASRIIVVHNHPGGDPLPSAADFQVTKLLGEACQAIGMPLVDHVIVASGGFASLAELGAL